MVTHSSFVGSPPCIARIARLLAWLRDTRRQLTSTCAVHPAPPRAPGPPADCSRNPKQCTRCGSNSMFVGGKCKECYKVIRWCENCKNGRCTSCDCECCTEPARPGQARPGQAALRLLTELPRRECLGVGRGRVTGAVCVNLQPPLRQSMLHDRLAVSVLHNGGCPAASALTPMRPAAIAPALPLLLRCCCSRVWRRKWQMRDVQARGEADGSGKKDPCVR